MVSLHPSRAHFPCSHIWSSQALLAHCLPAPFLLLSGVAMLFIEMILHISRSYLVEKNTERKKKRRA